MEKEEEQKVDDSIIENSDTKSKEEKEVIENSQDNIKNKEERKKIENEEAKLKNKHEKAKRTSLKIAIFLLIVILLLLLLSTIFAIINITNSNIISGIYIEEINLSNLTKDQANKIVSERLKNIEDIEFSYKDYSTIVKIEDLGLEVSAKEAINSAINIGRTNNIIIDNYNILKTNIFKTKLKLDIKLDETKFKDVIKNMQAEIPEAIKEYSYEIKGKELIITNGVAGEKIVEEELKNIIINNIKQQFNGTKKVANIRTKREQPQKINIEKIYSEIYKKPKNAYIVEKPFELYKEESGIDFAISINEAKQKLKEVKKVYSIPLKITEPEIKVADLGDKLFKQTLSKYTTIYDAGNTNRSHNIALAAKTINGTILLPGETFSYNGILGNTNKEKGYKLGTAYSGGKVVQSYGGGICQVSSTLYNSVLYANLEIVERYNHSYIVSYVPAGRDATVAYGGKDFKFKNTRKYPIKIVASAKNGVVSISIMGIKEEVEYEIELASTVLSKTPRTVEYQENHEIEEGKEKIIQSGYDGVKSIAYKIIKNSKGAIVEKVVLSKDTYKPMTKIIEVGTKKVTVDTSTIPTENNTVPEVQENILNNDGII